MEQQIIAHVGVLFDERSRLPMEAYLDLDPCADAEICDGRLRACIETLEDAERIASRLRALAAYIEIGCRSIERAQRIDREMQALAQVTP